MDALVRSPQPAGERGVEVGDGLEPAARQEAGLEVAVGPLDQSLRFRIVAATQLGADSQRAPERLERLTEHRLAAMPHSRSPLLVPHHPPGSAPNWPSTSRWPASTSWAWRDGIIQPPRNREKPHTPAITHSLSTWPWPIGMSTSSATDRTGRALRESRSCAGTDPVARTTGAARPPDRAAPGSNAPSPPARRSPSPASLETPATTRSPAAPRRRRPSPSRPAHGAAVPVPQRRPHRVPSQPKPTSDRLDAHPLRSMQPTDLQPTRPRRSLSLPPGSPRARVAWSITSVVDPPQGVKIRLPIGVSFHMPLTGGTVRPSRAWGAVRSVRLRQPGEARGIPAAEDP